MLSRLALLVSLALLLCVPNTEAQQTLENPGNGSFYSGIGVISGWKCTANGPLTVRFNGGAPISLAYGNERSDVRNAGACPSAHVGFVSIMNWGRLGDGSHTAVVYDNGVEFSRSTFEVATTGEEFVRGAVGECRVPDFPVPGESMRFAWNQATQHLEMVGGSTTLSCIKPDFICFDYIFDSQSLYASLYDSLAASCREDGYRVLPDTENCPPGPGCYDTADTGGAALRTTIYGLPASDVRDICTEVGATFVPDTGDGSGRSGGAATLENPGNGSFYSGIGVISGWKCTANGPLTVRFNGGAPISLAYGNERSDVRNAGACPSAHVGFVSIMNWGRLGDGSHTAVVYDNGVEFSRSTFEVATTGEEFVRGAVGECRVPDFPVPGESMRFAWNQATQHLEMVGGGGGGGSGGSGGGGGGGGSGGGGGGGEELGPPWSEAIVVRVGTETRGTLESAGDADYYRLDIPRAGIVLVEGYGSTDVRGVIYKGPGGTVVTGDTDSAAARQHKMRLSIPVESGPHYMRVSAGAGGEYTFKWSMAPGRCTASAREFTYLWSGEWCVYRVETPCPHPPPGGLFRRIYFCDEATWDVTPQGVAIPFCRPHTESLEVAWRGGTGYGEECRVDIYTVNQLPDMDLCFLIAGDCSYEGSLERWQEEFG